MCVRRLFLSYKGVDWLEAVVENVNISFFTNIIPTVKSVTAVTILAILTASQLQYGHISTVGFLCGYIRSVHANKHRFALNVSHCLHTLLSYVAILAILTASQLQYGLISTVRLLCGYIRSLHANIHRFALNVSHCLHTLLSYVAILVILTASPLRYGYISTVGLLCGYIRSLHANIHRFALNVPIVSILCFHM